MTDKRWRSNPRTVSDLSGKILDPVLRKRAGISVGLVQSWEEIVGVRVSQRSRPEKIVWPRRMSDDDPFEPATLVIACEALAAMHIQHEAGEIMSRINSFLGFQAIGRLRIVQKPVATVNNRKPPKLRSLTKPEEARLDKSLTHIEDAGLREALEKLGRAVIARKST